MPARLKHISECVKELIAKHKPNAICVEELFFKATERRLFCAEARGAIILSCMDSDIAMYEHTPLQIKQAITGYGRADKTKFSKW